MNAYLHIYLILFGFTPAPSGQFQFPQMTILQEFDSLEACHKAVEKTDLTPQQKDDIGCVRVLRGNAHWIRA